MTTRAAKGTPILERIRMHSVVTSEGCWEWQGTIETQGYGRFKPSKLAHRASYEAFVGPIPDGLTLDHLCRNRACVNPDHLEPVTHRENVLRGIGPTAVNARKTHCHKGHAFTIENTYIRRGWRNCRACKRLRDQVRRERARAS